MELLFESRSNLGGFHGKIYFRQGQAELLPEPVLVGDTPADGTGASIYGTVLKDGGVYRMWYQAWPRDWTGHDTALVGYAESDNGLDWRKPALGIVEYNGSTANHLCNLGFHSPSIFIDPTAPTSHRYRATGFTGPSYVGAPAGTGVTGYYTAHSADGLHWTPDAPEPRWPQGDVITSVYHPAQGRAITALKISPRANGFQRRAVWNAELRDGAWSREICALVPDEFDDVCAIARGLASGDYYGMGMLPAGTGTAGFLWQFRHSLPRTAGNGAGVFGITDVSLVYQEAPGARWLHAAGRPDFISHGTLPWTEGGIYTSSCPVEVGSEQWLYLCGAKHTHAWYLNERWELNQALKDQLIGEGIARIGIARWPKDRLFGFTADPEGGLTIDLGEITVPSTLALNYTTEPGGSVRVALIAGEPIAGRTAEEVLPLTGQALDAAVTWQDGPVIQPQHGRHVSAVLSMDRATVYAYEVTPYRG
ncbi:MAG: hypothetical protein ACYDCO_25365 [Armatimonadota bacterium]